MAAQRFAGLATQSPPRLHNQYRDDLLLGAWLNHRLPQDVLDAVQGDLEELGELAGGSLYEMQLEDRLNEPRLTQWDAWGRRVDRIELTPLWQEAEPLAARFGLVAAGYEPDHGAHARTVQFALAYLFIPSTDFFGCPLAMSDGAARILHDAGNAELAGRALPRLLSRDPERFWTSGQWMTEVTGGSDVSGTETVARKDEGGHWRLYGRKWFTSAASSQMALTLARPEGNPDGSKGLALFYVEPRDRHGELRKVEILRLKDKLGTRKVPTAELLLDGLPATPVAGLERGVAAIAPMLNLTRTWNAVTACALMRRGIALATDYARRRQAFGKPLIDHPLHARTLAEMHAEHAVAFAATFATIAELGRVEHDAEGASAARLRLLTPLIKLGTAKACIGVCSETLEAFGGAGYVEDTGLPLLLRDAQVLSIWEGTTNVLALDLLRALAGSGPAAWLDAVRARLDGAGHERLAPVRRACEAALEAIGERLKRSSQELEPGARGLALSMYAVTGLAELASLAEDALARGDGRPADAARLYAAARMPRLVDPDPAAERAMLDNAD